MDGRAIFRESAVEAYRRGAKKDVVPRLTSWPVIACAWLLLVGLAAAVLLAWSVRVPTYVSATGVILGPPEQPRPAGGGTAAVLLLPPERSADLRVGQPVHGQVGSTGTYVEGAVAKVQPGVIGPDAALRHYPPDDGSELVTGPTSVVIVQLRTTLPSAAYGGSRLTAQVEIGSQRLLELVPGLGGLSGGDG